MPPGGDERRSRRRRGTSIRSPPPSPPSPPHLPLIPSSPSKKSMVDSGSELRTYLWRLSPLDPHPLPNRSYAMGDSEMGIEWSIGGGKGMEESSGGGKGVEESSGGGMCMEESSASGMAMEASTCSNGMGIDWREGNRSLKRRRFEGMGIDSGSHEDTFVPETELQLQGHVPFESIGKDVQASVVQPLFHGVDHDAETDDESIQASLVKPLFDGVDPDAETDD